MQEHIDDMAPVRIGLHGATGRMGLSLVRAIAQLDGVTLSGGYEPATSDHIGADLGRLAGLDPNHALVGNDLDALLADTDVLIDFSRPAGFEAALAGCRRTNTALVSGTTGLDASQFAMLDDAGQDIATLHAMNFSLGVAVLRALAEQAARMLGGAADVEIIEAHHRHKVDAPSGTALALGQSVAAGLGVNLDDKAAWARHGDTGPRSDGAIGFAVVRGGDIVGEHTALFAMQGERVEVSHRATDRMIFARGAVHAARWLVRQTPGRYGLEDSLQV